MKTLIITILTVAVIGTGANAQIGGIVKSKAKDITGAAKLPASKDTKAMEGTWKVDGVIVTTEMEALKPQLAAQEKQYNDAYTGSTWVFKKDGSISITLPKSAASPGGTGTGKYELNGEKIYMEINNQPGEYDLKFEDGQMLLVNVSPLNTVYYVFVK